MTTIAAACCALALNQQGGTPTSPSALGVTQPQQIPLSTLLQAAPAVAEPTRLEITPGMQGTIENEEWDPFVTAPDSKTFLQWEPGIIFVAGSGPVGTDLLLSLDLGNNGWLVGNDNIEARVSVDTSGKAMVSVRRLNANNVAGPIWEDLSGWSLSSLALATTANGRVDYELALSDANLGVLPRRAQKIAARADLIPTQEPPIGSNQPRALSPLSLATNRAEGLPSTLHYGVEKPELAVPGESTSVRFNFSDPKAQTEQPAKKITISGEGLMQNTLSSVTAPFPQFGTKTKCFVDYQTKVGLDAATGYHVLKAVLTLSDDTPATVETSFQVAPIIDVELQNPRMGPAGQDRDVAITLAIKSNLPKPMKGSLTFSLDPKFRVLNRSNNEERFILEPKGRINRKFQIFVTGNTKGTYPIEFDITAGNYKKKLTRYVTFG